MLHVENSEQQLHQVAIAMIKNLENFFLHIQKTIAKLRKIVNGTFWNQNVLLQTCSNVL